MRVEKTLEAVHGEISGHPTPSNGHSLIASWLRLLQAFGSRADLFVMLALLWLVAKYYLSQRTPLFIGEIEFFDTSWALDLVDKAHRGVWLGKGAIFTNGPLFQWLLSWGPLHEGVSLGSFYRYIWVFHYGTTLLALYGTGALLLHRQPSWVRAFYLVSLLIFWVPIHLVVFNVKLLLPLCWFAALLRIFPDQATDLPGRTWRAAVAASLIAVAFLLSSDSGVYTLAAFFLVLAASLVYEHGSSDLKGAATYTAITGMFFLAWILTINAATGRLLDFHFWRTAYEVVAQYRWAQSMFMQPSTTSVFWLALSVNLVIFLAQWFVFQKGCGTSAHARRDWLAMLGFVTIAMQSVLVCSERFHMTAGLFVWIALSFALLLGAAEKSLSTLRLAIASGVIIVLTAIFSGPNHFFLPRNFLLDRSVITSTHSCLEGLHEIDGVCLQPTDFVRLRTVRDYLAQHTKDSDSVGVFPYQAIYSFVGRRRMAGELVQNYIAAGHYLSVRQTESLEQARPPLAIYAAEPWQSTPLLGVYNFTRNPQIWFYWQRWYKNDVEAAPGLVILRRDEERGRRWKVTSTSILAHPMPASRENEIDLPLGVVSDLDFLRIDVKADYSVWWRLLRPSSIVVRIRFDNGLERNVYAIVQPDHRDEIWIYPWEQAQLSNYFLSDPTQWRLGLRPRIQSLSLHCEPKDWIAVAPSRITIQDVRAVKLSEE